MNTISFDPHWTYRGLRALLLENRYLRAVVLPELGAKIWSLVDKAADREILWHNPRVPPRPAIYGVAYDDWFCGGWDELFPNDAPAVIGGDAYPDHGELWSMPYDWNVDVDAHEIRLRLSRSGVVTPTFVEKSITLRADEPVIRIRYRIRNDGSAPLDFLLKLHPALAISPRCRIDLPARTVLVDAGFRQRLGAKVERFTWSLAHSDAGATVDMRQVPPQNAALCDFFYAIELDAGWCALTDTARATGFGLAFDPAVFRSVWVFGAYGGWRGLYTTILEPCTGYPYRLEEAIAQGTASRLEPGAELDTEVTAVLYRGISAVEHIDRNGAVR
jgi:hypothetical protein